MEINGDLGLQTPKVAVSVKVTLEDLGSLDPALESGSQSFAIGVGSSGLQGPTAKAMRGFPGEEAETGEASLVHVVEGRAAVCGLFESGTGGVQGTEEVVGDGEAVEVGVLHEGPQPGDEAEGAPSWLQINADGILVGSASLVGFGAVGGQNQKNRGQGTVGREGVGEDLYLVSGVQVEEA